MSTGRPMGVVSEKTGKQRFRQKGVARGTRKATQWAVACRFCMSGVFMSFGVPIQNVVADNSEKVFGGSAQPCRARRRAMGAQGQEGETGEENRKVRPALDSGAPRCEEIVRHVTHLPCGGRCAQYMRGLGRRRPHRQGRGGDCGVAVIDYWTSATWDREGSTDMKAKRQYCWSPARKLAWSSPMSFPRKEPEPTVVAMGCAAPELLCKGKTVLNTGQEPAVVALQREVASRPRTRSGNGEQRGGALRDERAESVAMAWAGQHAPTLVDLCAEGAGRESPMQRARGFGPPAARGGHEKWP